MSGFGVADLTVEFDGVEAISAITLEVPAGAVTAVVGGDGAGKTTLLKCLVRLIAPSGGTVRAPPKSQIGYMPSTSGTWRELSVKENMQFVGRAYGLPAELIGRRSELLLDRAGLAGASDRLSGQLSGGMRQKLGFCMTVLHEPELLVLDEPSTGVDAISRVELWRLIARAAADGAAVLMATTYLDEAERAAGVLALDAGRPLLRGEPGQLLAGREGSIVEIDKPTDAALAWRRGGSFHQWQPATMGRAGNSIEPDLEDVLIVEMLRAEHGPARRR